MTYAPRTLLDARAVIKRYTGLSDNAVGIVGDEAHNGGYHQGWDKRRIVDGILRDYSWQESPRDWNHKTDAASAIDIGWFTKLVDGRPISLIDFNMWLVHQLNIGAPDTLDIRSFIYTPDGKTVKRWDRLGRRTTGDSSHTLHSHLSRFRDAENKPIAPLFTRFFKVEEEEMKTALVAANGGDGRIWLSNGIIRVHVANHDTTDKTSDDETVLRDVRWVGSDNVLGHLVNGDIKWVDDLDSFGKEFPHDFAARLNRIEQKLDALAAQQPGETGPIPDQVTITGGSINFGPSE